MIKMLNLNRQVFVVFTSFLNTIPIFSHFPSQKYLDDLIHPWLVFVDIDPEKQS